MAGVTSYQILNTIRSNATETYQERVPVATQQNLANVGSAITSYDVTKNEFIDSLINRIGIVLIQNKSWANPLRRFKKGQLPYGKDIEDIFVDIVKGHSFDQEKAETEVFKRELPNVKTIFHRLDRQDYYKTTISDEELNMAFLSDRGIMDLISKIINALYTSDEYDEYLLMKQLLIQYMDKDLMYKIHADEVTDQNSANAFLVKMRATANRLKFLSTNYNAEGVHTATNPRDLVIFLTPETQAYIDVESLARAFNLDKADFIGNVVTVDDFGDKENVIAVAVDKSFFMVYDKLYSARTQYNSQGLYYNVFFHHWQLLSTSRFANAIMFTSDDVPVDGIPRVNSVTITNEEVTIKQGGILQINANVDVTGGASKQLAYTIVGQTKAGTTINQNGVLTIASDEPIGNNIEVTVQSVIDTSKRDTHQLSVVGV